MATTTKADRSSAEEKDAMRDRARELKAQASGSDGEAEVLATKIDEMPNEERALLTPLFATTVVGLDLAGPHPESGRSPRPDCSSRSPP